MDEAKQETYQGGRVLISAIILAILTYWLFGQSFLNIGPIVQNTYGTTNEVINIAISLVSLFTGVFMVTAGGFADHYGRVKIMRIGLILSIIGSLLLIISHADWLLLLGRAIQGFSAACLMPATISLVNTYYQGAERHKALSMWSIGSYGGTGGALLISGLIASSLGWQWIFILSIIVSVISLYLIRQVPESKGTDHPAAFDVIGLVLFIIFMLSLNIIISMGRQIGWLSGISISLILIFIVALVAFIVIERKSKNPFIDFSLFSNRSYVGAVIANFLLNTSVGSLALFNIFTQTHFKISGATAGFITIPYIVGVFVTIRVGEHLMQRYSAKMPLILGSAVLALGMLLISLTFLPFVLYVISALIGFLFFGLGLGFFATPGLNTAVSSVPSEKVGVASGIYKMGATIAAAFGITLYTSVYNIIAAGSGAILAAFVSFFINFIFLVAAVVILKYVLPRTKINF